MQGLVLICLCPFNILVQAVSYLFEVYFVVFVLLSTRWLILLCFAWILYMYIFFLNLLLNVDSLYLQVNMIDFFLSDQLTSQVSYFAVPSIGDMDLHFINLDFWPLPASAWPQTQAIRSFVYYICYYGWGKGSKGRKMCHVSDVYIVFYYISAAIPFWIRFLQVLNISSWYLH